MDSIAVKDIREPVKIGVDDREREIGQRLRFDLEVGLDTRLAGASDDLEHTVSYVQLVHCLKATARSRPFKLIENLAHCIALELLANFYLLANVTVRVHKPHIADVDFDGNASVCVSRSRDDL